MFTLIYLTSARTAKNLPPLLFPHRGVWQRCVRNSATKIIIKMSSQDKPFPEWSGLPSELEWSTI